VVYVIVIVLIVLSVAFYGNTTAANLRQERDHVRAVAEQMVYFHSASAQACGGTCPTGLVDPSPRLSSMRRGNGVFDVDYSAPPAFPGQTFVSASVGQFVYTFHTGAGIEPSRQAWFSSLVLEQVSGRTRRDTGLWSGIYDAATQTVEAEGAPVWVDPETYQPATGTVATVSLAGAPTAIPDGTVVIVNRK
jgi:hypothetical protein